MGLNVRKYLIWMIAAAGEGIGVWFLVWAGYGGVLGMVQDNNLYPLGELAFSIGVLWINYKLLWVLFLMSTCHAQANKDIVLSRLTINPS